MNYLCLEINFVSNCSSAQKRKLYTQSLLLQIEALEKERKKLSFLISYSNGYKAKYKLIWSYGNSTTLQCVPKCKESSNYSIMFLQTKKENLWPCYFEIKSICLISWYFLLFSILIIFWLLTQNAHYVLYKNFLQNRKFMFNISSLITPISFILSSSRSKVENSIIFEWKKQKFFKRLTLLSITKFL